MRLVPKLLTAVLLVLALMVGGLLVAVHGTFESRLSHYLLRVETAQMEPLARLLAREYRVRGGWGSLRDDRGRWLELVTEAVDRPVQPVADVLQPSNEVRGMMPRLSVVDAAGEYVFRRPLAQAPENRDWIELPIVVESARVGTLRMLPTPVPVRGLDEQFRSDQMRAFYLAALPALLLTLLIALLLGYHFVKPLRQLTRALHALGRGQYRLRLPSGRRDELGQVAADVNRLAEVLERSDALRREGMASVSHELRTPLATLIAEVDAMQEGIRPLDSAQLRVISGSLEHLNRLVDDLYLLALADVKTLVCHREPLPLDAVVAEGVAAARTRLEARGLVLDTRLEPDTMIMGDEKRLRQLVDNLLENCRRYSRDGGTVTVSLRRDAGRAELTVADDGPGVSEEVMGSLFERFFRADKSRNRERGGAGLGLALVRAIAEAHDGSVNAFRTAPGGLGITVSLPLAPLTKGE